QKTTRVDSPVLPIIDGTFRCSPSLFLSTFPPLSVICLVFFLLDRFVDSVVSPLAPPALLAPPRARVGPSRPAVRVCVRPQPPSPRPAREGDGCRRQRQAPLRRRRQRSVAGSPACRRCPRAPSALPRGRGPRSAPAPRSRRVAASTAASPGRLCRTASPSRVLP